MDISAPGNVAVVPADCVAGSSREIHDFQVTNILPLLATVTTAEEIATTLTAVRRG